MIFIHVINLTVLTFTSHFEDSDYWVFGFYMCVILISVLGRILSETIEYSPIFKIYSSSEKKIPEVHL